MANEVDADHDTHRLPPLSLGQRWALARRIWADRLVRGWPLVLAGGGLAVALLALALALTPPGRAQALVLARPTLPAQVVTATPSLVESLAVVATATPEPPPPPTAEPAPVVVYAAPPEPTAEPAPAELVPVVPPAVVYVAQAAEPTPSELTRIEPAGDGGQWIIEEQGNGRSISTYVPPPAPPGLAPEPPAPTPHFGELGGGGGGWND